MVTFNRSILIDRSKKEIFDFASDPANFAHWQDNVQFAQWTSEKRFGTGSTQYSISRLLDRVYVSMAEITLWDAPNQLVYKVDKPFLLETGMTFEGNNGRTKVTMVGKAKPGVFFELDEKVFGKFMELLFDSDLKSLKLNLESNIG